MHAHAGDVPIVVLSGYDDETDGDQGGPGRRPGLPGQGQGGRQPAGPLDPLRHRAEPAATGPKRPCRDASEEFRAAQEIQQRLYPLRSPALPGFDIAGALYPAKATAGDYFDYIPMLDGCLGIVVGDVSSHGMGPALLMSETRACLRTLAQTHCDVGEILTRANRVLAGRHRRFPLRHPGPGPARSPRPVASSMPAPGSGATCSTRPAASPCWTAPASRWGSRRRRSSPPPRR